MLFSCLTYAFQASFKCFLQLNCTLLLIFPSIFNVLHLILHVSSLPLPYTCEALTISLYTDDSQSSSYNHDPDQFNISTWIQIKLSSVYVWTQTLEFLLQSCSWLKFPHLSKRNHNYPIVHAYLFPFLLTWYVIYQHILTFLSRYLSESDLISLWIITKTLAKTSYLSLRL